MASRCQGARLSGVHEQKGNHPQYRRSASTWQKAFFRSTALMRCHCVNLHLATRERPRWSERCWQLTSGMALSPTMSIAWVGSLTRMLRTLSGLRPCCLRNDRSVQRRLNRITDRERLHRRLSDVKPGPSCNAGATPLVRKMLAIDVRHDALADDVDRVGRKLDENAADVVGAKTVLLAQ